MSSSAGSNANTTPLLSQPTLDVTGRAFVITGGTQGLGLAVAQVLQQHGAAGLALVSRHDNSNVRDQLTTSSCRVVHIETDLADATLTSTVIDRAHQALAGMAITGLINAAATTARGNLETETAEGMDRHFQINVRAPFLLTQALARHIQGQPANSSTPQFPDVSIVNIGSCAAHGGAPFVMAYSASKAALGVMTKTHAAELASTQIRVNTVHMGWCATDREDELQRHNSGKDWLAQADANVPLGRILRPVDVACTVLFLSSPASRMMTGSVIELHPEFPHGMLSLAKDESEGR